MRPNIDIPGELNQQVKDLKMVTDADNLSQAYIKALKAGLRQYPNPSYLSRVGTPSSSFDTESIDFIKFLNNQTFKNIIWSKYLYRLKNKLVTFGGSVDSMSHSELNRITRSIAPYLSNNGSDSQYAISQFSGQWIGNGIQDFVAALETREERYEKWSPRKTHNREKGMLISNMRRGGLLIIYFQRRVGKDILENGSIEFITDGIPLETRPYEEVASIFDTSLTNAHLTDIPVKDILDRDRLMIEQNCIQELRCKDEGVNTFITSVKIDNILTQNHVSELDKPERRAILEPDEIICHLGHHRMKSKHDDHGTDFCIDNLKIQTLPTSREPLFRIQCTADWQGKSNQ